MRRLDLIGAGFWLFISAIAGLESYRLGLGSFHRPGSGFLPLLAASVLGSLSLFLFLKTLLKGKNTEEEGWENPKGWPKMVFVFAALLVYALVLEKIGFLVITFLLLLGMVKVFEPQSWRKAVVFSFLGSFFCYLLFQKWLQAQLPPGILPF